MKRLRTLKLFQIFSTEIKKSKTYSGWCPFKGLFNGTTLMQIQSGWTVPLKVLLEEPLLLLYESTIQTTSLKQCCGSMTFWCGSGSVDPCLWLMDPDSDPDADPDPSIFIIDLQDANKKLMFFKVFLHITFWRYFYIIFQEKKSKRSHKTVEIKVFHTIFA